MSEGGAADAKLTAIADELLRNLQNYDSLLERSRERCCAIAADLAAAIRATLPLRAPPSFERSPRKTRADHNKRVEIWEKTGGYCTYCRVQLDFSRNFEIDHVTPKRWGGTDARANLTPACQPCNARKHARDLRQFLGVLPSIKEAE